MRTLLGILAALTFTGCTSHLVKATKPGPIQADPQSAVYVIPLRGAEEADITEQELVDSDQKMYSVDLSDPSYVNENGLKYYFVVLDPTKSYAVVGSGNRSKIYRYSREFVENHQLSVQPGIIALAPAVKIVRDDLRDLSDVHNPLDDVDAKRDMKKLFPDREIKAAYH